MSYKIPKTINMINRTAFHLKTRSRMILPLQHFATVTSPPQPPKGSQGPTGVLLMNLGGPSNLDEVQPFLHRLFADPELIPIPFQKYLAPWIALRRTPKIKDQYAQIGGGSPIRMWTEKQAEEMVKLLDQLSPKTAPHKPYIAFRYAPPLTEDTVEQIKKDGIKRVVAFTQYPQYSCSTTGSSLNELVHHVKSNNLEKEINFSVIDRWHNHPGLVDAFVDRIETKLSEYSDSERGQVPILFSAHSLPMSVVNRGDAYPSEVASTVTRVMEKLNRKNPYYLVWQSQVGPSAWLGPQTSDALKGLAEQGEKNALLVPIAFTSDHIETLFELDLEYGEEAKELGISGFKRADSLNDSPIFIKAMADLVHQHISSNYAHSTQLSTRCPGCKRESCKSTREFFMQQDEKNTLQSTPTPLNRQSINQQTDATNNTLQA